MNSKKPRSVRLLLLDDLEAREDWVIERIRHTVMGLAPYAALEAIEARDVFEGSVRLTFRAFNDHLRTGKPWSDEELMQFESIGVIRARQGVPRDTLRWAFRLAYDLCTQELTRMARERSEPEALDTLVDLLHDLKGLSDRAEDALLASFDVELPQSEASRAPQRVRLVDRILAGAIRGDNNFSVAEALRWSRTDRSVLVIVVPVDDGWGSMFQLHRVADDLAGVLPGGVVGPVLRSPVPYAVALAAWPTQHIPGLGKVLSQ